MASSFVPRLLGLAYGPAQPQSDVSDHSLSCHGYVPLPLQCYQWHNYIEANEAAASVEIQLVGGWLK